MATPLTAAHRSRRMRVFVSAVAGSLFCALLVWRNRRGKGV